LSSPMESLETAQLVQLTNQSVLEASYRLEVQIELQFHELCRVRQDLWDQRAQPELHLSAEVWILRDLLVFVQASFGASEDLQLWVCARNAEEHQGHHWV